MAPSDAVISVVDAFPELVSDLDLGRAELARRHAVAAVETLAPGIWEPDRAYRSEPGHLGLLASDD